jgi:adenylate kinase
VNLIFVGPPGSGKGTQSSALAQKLGVPAISTGNMLRDEVRRKTALGMQAKRYMDKGELIPDPLMVETLHERLAQPGCARGFILDGFPRTVAQAEALDAMLATLAHPLRRVVSLTVPRVELVKRLAGRRTCRDCGAMYHIIYDPPTNAAHCNKCHGELYQRDDDHEDIVTSRLDVYDRQTAPLLQYYRDRGLLTEVSGIGGREDVLDRVLDAVRAPRP